MTHVHISVGVHGLPATSGVQRFVPDHLPQNTGVMPAHMCAYMHTLDGTGVRAHYAVGAHHAGGCAMAHAQLPPNLLQLAGYRHPPGQIDGPALGRLRCGCAVMLVHRLLQACLHALTGKPLTCPPPALHITHIKHPPCPACKQRCAATAAVQRQKLWDSRLGYALGGDRTPSKQVRGPPLRLIRCVHTFARGTSSPPPLTIDTTVDQHCPI